MWKNVVPSGSAHFALCTNNPCTSSNSRLSMSAMMASCDSHILWRPLGRQQEPVRSTWGEDAIVNVVILDTHIVSRICISLALCWVLPATRSLTGEMYCP